MSVLINQKDCQTVRKNLGLSDCLTIEGIPKGIILVPKGWAINLETDTFNRAYVDEQIQLSNFIPILGSVEITNNTPEATTEEYQGGVKSVVRNGLPEFSVKYLKGWKFANLLHTYNSFQSFDVLITFASGAIAGATNGTELTGFDMGMLNTGTYMFSDGSTSASVMLMFQLIDEIQFNQNVAVLDASVLDFKVNTDIQPITDIKLIARASASDAKVYFKAYFNTNLSDPLGGIAIANLRSTINGTVDTITAASLSYNSLTQEWSYTPTATLVASDTVIVQLYDSVNVVDVAKIGTRFYKGTSNTAVTVA